MLNSAAFAGAVHLDKEFDQMARGLASAGMQCASGFSSSRTFANVDTEDARGAVKKLPA